MTWVDVLLGGAGVGGCGPLDANGMGGCPQDQPFTGGIRGVPTPTVAVAGLGCALSADARPIGCGNNQNSESGESGNARRPRAGLGVAAARRFRRRDVAP